MTSLVSMDSFRPRIQRWTTFGNSPPSWWRSTPSRTTQSHCWRKNGLTRPSNGSRRNRPLTRCLSGVLLSQRHRLTVAARSAHRVDRKTRLGRAVRAMARAVSPPLGRVCVNVGNDGTMIVVESDGETIRGGAVADAAEQRFLPVIYTPAADSTPSPHGSCCARGQCEARATRRAAPRSSAAWQHGRQRPVGSTDVCHGTPGLPA